MGPCWEEQGWEGGHRTARPHEQRCLGPGWGEGHKSGTPSPCTRSSPQFSRVSWWPLCLTPPWPSNLTPASSIPQGDLGLLRDCARLCRKPGLRWRAGHGGHLHGDTGARGPGFPTTSSNWDRVAISGPHLHICEMQVGPDLCSPSERCMAPPGRQGWARDSSRERPFRKHKGSALFSDLWCPLPPSARPAGTGFLLQQWHQRAVTHRPQTGQGSSLPPPHLPLKHPVLPEGAPSCSAVTTFPRWALWVPWTRVTWRGGSTQSFPQPRSVGLGSHLGPSGFQGMLLPECSSALPRQTLLPSRPRRKETQQPPGFAFR